MKKIIALSGIDGSGKSTCAEMIRQLFTEHGENAIIEDSMQGGQGITCLKEVARKRRTDLRQCFSSDAINLCITLDLIERYKQQKENCIANEKNVIFHRSSLCCRVYSKLFSENDPTSDRLLDSIEDIQYDFHFYLKISPEAAYERILQRAGGKEIKVKEQLSMLHRAEDLYQEYLSKENYGDVMCISAEQPRQELRKTFERLLF